MSAIAFQNCMVILALYLLSNGKYIAIVGFETFADVQLEKSARCNIDYDRVGAPRKSTRYVSPAMIQMKFLFQISVISVMIVSRGRKCCRG